MDLSDDILTGIDAISDFIGMKPKTTAHMHRQKLIPTQTIGRLVIARKSVLNRHFHGGAPD